MLCTRSYNWRGLLVEAEVKDEELLNHGHRVLYSYDASDRLLFSKHLDEDDVFISERLFVWDNAGLTAEVGLNHLREVLWQKQYLPGPAGFDGSPQVRVQTGLTTEDIFD